MTYAIIKTGGKQYKVSEGDVLKIEKITGKVAGDTVSFDEVLLVDDGSNTTVGAPLIKGATVSATIKSVLKQKKVFTMKYKPKSNKTGKIKNHRQTLATIKIDKITK
jgi:large subunit ribosomal protein L21